MSNRPYTSLHNRLCQNLPVSVTPITSQSQQRQRVRGMNVQQKERERERGHHQMILSQCFSKEMGRSAFADTRTVLGSDNIRGGRFREGFFFVLSGHVTAWVHFTNKSPPSATANQMFLRLPPQT